jgi:hypothetical protein
VITSVSMDETTMDELQPVTKAVGLEKEDFTEL